MDIQEIYNKAVAKKTKQDSGFTGSDYNLSESQITEVREAEKVDDILQDIVKKINNAEGMSCEIDEVDSLNLDALKSYKVTVKDSESDIETSHLFWFGYDSPSEQVLLIPKEKFLDSGYNVVRDRSKIIGSYITNDARRITTTKEQGLQNFVNKLFYDHVNQVYDIKKREAISGQKQMLLKL